MRLKIDILEGNDNFGDCVYVILGVLKLLSRFLCLLLFLLPTFKLRTTYYMGKIRIVARKELTPITILDDFPLRMIDIKRIRDIVDRNLTRMETTLVAVVFSIPFIDFFSTMFF